MSRGLLLGIDIGMSSTKGVLVHPNGIVLARSIRSHNVPERHGRQLEVLWWQDFTDVVHELLIAADERRIGGLAISGAGACLVTADGRGRPLRPALLDGSEVRTTQEISEINAEFGAEAILRRCGSALTGQSAGPRLKWLAKHEPAVYRNMRMLLTASSFLVHRLTGHYVLDHHSACRWAPLYDLSAAEWNSDWSVRVAPGVPLPRLLWPAEIAGNVTAVASTLTGLQRGLPVTVGTVDTLAGAMGAGVCALGDVMVEYGADVSLVQVAAKAGRRHRLSSASGVNATSFTMSADVASSDASKAWLRVVNGREFGDLAEQAALVPPGSRGLVLHPRAAGEPTLADIAARHWPAEVYRATLEDIAYGVWHTLELMARAGGPATRLVAIGGGRYDLLRQIVSDVTGLPQHVPAEALGVCLGDAMFAAMATGVPIDHENWNPTTRTVRPNPGSARYYADFRDCPESYFATAATAHFLAE